MQSRLVTVTLAVALGLGAVGVARSQDLQPADAADIGPVFDEIESTESTGLPLGELGPQIGESQIGESLAETPATDLSRVERDGEWLYSARRAFSRAPWNRIAMIGIAAGVMLWAGWAMLSGFRRRARRVYRRAGPPIPKGETRQQRLEEVVASVQFPDRPLTADLRYLDESTRSEARSANPGIGSRPTGVELPIDL